MQRDTQGQRARGGSRFNNALFSAAVADATGLPRRGGHKRGSSSSGGPGSAQRPKTSAGTSAAGVSGGVATSGSAEEGPKQSPVGGGLRQAARPSNSDRTSQVETHAQPVDQSARSTTPEGPPPPTSPPTVRTRTEFAGIMDLITAEQASLLYSVLDDARAAEEPYNYEAEVCGEERQRTREELEEVGAELIRNGKAFGVIDILRKYGKPGEAEAAAMRMQINTDHAPDQTPSAAGPPPPQTDTDDDLPMAPAAQYE